VRQEIIGEVIGEGADFQLRGVNLLAGDTHTDVTMVLDHKVPHTTSEEIVRNVVMDKSQGAFQGQIKVHKRAQKTDARMACNTLLLSDEGGFSTKPELEIFADDVQCGHGATVAEIDHNHLFYMMSRGISDKDARRLLVKAFVREIIEDLEDETLVEALEDKLDHWFELHG
jgi:Fe-S cluster assembly protein SufD